MLKAELNDHSCFNANLDTMYSFNTISILNELSIDKTLLIYASELAHIPNNIDTKTQNDLQMLILVLLINIKQGNTRMSLNAKELFNALGYNDFNIGELLTNPNLDCILGKSGDVRPLIVKEQYLYTHRTLSTETSLIKSIKLLLNSINNNQLPMNNSLIDSLITPNKEQLEAVSLTLQNGLSLITGGPGTGKTFVLATIIKTLVCKLNIDIGKVAIAAPTGKAAQRINDTIQAILAQLPTNNSDKKLLSSIVEPKTLHRLLSWHPTKQQFNHNEKNPIDAKVVIVDEASMISQELMDQLLKAITPDARIVLLGDVDQLPSIDGGCAFRDMVLTLTNNTKKLTKNYRMLPDNPEGHAIISLAQTINLGLSNNILESNLYQIKDSKNWLGSKVELIEEDDLTSFLQRWFQELVIGCDNFFELANRVYKYTENCTWDLDDEAALKAIFAHFDNFRILCVLKNANKLRGVKEINKIMHNWMYQYTGFGLQHEVAFFSGEPVMMTVNDYKRDIFNGDQGLILKVTLDGDVHQAVVFPDKNKFLALPLSSIKHQLELCYAMTVHKAQGSEYDKVAIVLPNTINHPALTREILYTGITRARKSVTLLSNNNQLIWAIKNNIKRNTGLKTELQLAYGTAANDTVS